MRRTLFLLLCCLLLTGCARDPIQPLTEDVSDVDVPLPAAQAPSEEEHSVTLWFRFGEEPYLAPETRLLSSTQTDSDPLTLLQALLAGPSAAATELEGLFPNSTKALSVTQSGRVMFVTLSRHIMNGYADEPDSWRSDTYWAVEVPLRRKLAMQAIAATLTENYDVDTVVILVEQTGVVTDSLRLRQSYYTLDGDASLADPLCRDELLLLTPARTAEIILQCWQESDWARLYRYVAQTDPATGTVRPAEEDFVKQMAAGSQLLHASASGGSLSSDGCTMVFTVSGSWLNSGTEAPFSGLTLRLTKEKGLWRVGFSQLTGREAQP